MKNYSRELSFARQLGQRAMEMAMQQLASAALGVEIKEDHSPVTAVDTALSAFIVSALRREFPDDLVVSEESLCDPALLSSAQRVWLLDPVDGTKELIAGNGQWSVQIALCVEGEPVLGVVAQPTEKCMYSAAKGCGAFVDRPSGSEPLPVLNGDNRPLRATVSRSHADPGASALMDKLGVHERIPYGSLGLKCVLIVEGKAEFYANYGGFTKIWDTAAGHALLLELGGDIYYSNGKPLRYAQLHGFGISEAYVAASKKNLRLLTQS